MDSRLKQIPNVPQHSTTNIKGCLGPETKPTLHGHPSPWLPHPKKQTKLAFDSSWLSLFNLENLPWISDSPWVFPLPFISLLSSPRPAAPTKNTPRNPLKTNTVVPCCRKLIHPFKLGFWPESYTMHSYLILPSLHFSVAPFGSFASLLADI